MPWPSPPRAACQHHPALPLLEGHCFDHFGRHALRSATLLRLTQRLVTPHCPYWKAIALTTSAATRSAVRPCSASRSAWSRWSASRCFPSCLQGRGGGCVGEGSCQTTPCSALPLPPPCLPPFPLSHPSSLPPPRPWLLLDRPLSPRRRSPLPLVPPSLPAPLFGIKLVDNQFLTILWVHQQRKCDVT